MALRASSLFLYNFQVTTLNNSIDFKASSGGSVLFATITQGFYSLSSLATEIARAMNAADPSNSYVVTIDRTVNLGQQNRVTVATSGSFLSLLFSSGPRTASTAAPLIGFAVSDRTGSTTYTGSSSAGTALITEKEAFNYLPVEMDHMIFGNVNISANGTKEVVVFQIQQFWSGEWKYEPESKVKVQWLPLMDWMIQGRLFDFTPETNHPTVFYTGTLEKTSKDGKALGFQWKEMLPNFPFNYQTGPMVFRLNIS